MIELSFKEISDLVLAEDFNEPVARAFWQAMRLERIAEKIADGDERRKRDLLIALGPCIPTSSIVRPA